MMKYKTLIFLYILSSLCGCSAGFETPLRLTNQVYWTKVLSVGPKIDSDGFRVSEFGYVANECGSNLDCIHLEWIPFIEINLGLPEGYAVYRKVKSSNSSLKKIGTTATNSYSDIDTSIELGETYIYKIYPIYRSGTVYKYMDDLPQIEVLKAPENMAFVHRSMVNKQTCEDMSRTIGSGPNQIDLNNNYRCPYEGRGSVLIDGVNYYDFGKHLLVDRFETGCDFSKSICSPHDPGDGSSTTDCFGAATPTALSVTAPLNSVFHKRGINNCYINTDGAGLWVVYSAATTPQKQIMSKNNAYLPPITQLNAVAVYDYCNTRTVTLSSGYNVQMNLSRRSDFLAYTHWDKIINSDANINSIEQGSATSGYCNADSGHGIAWSTGYPGPDIELLAGTAARPLFISGSQKTSFCSSKFGVQDAVGNAYEWTSDMIFNNAGVVSSVDPTNDDFVGIDFSGQVGPGIAYDVLLTNYPYFNIPLGFPLLCTAISPAPDPACTMQDLEFTSASTPLFGDRYYRSGAAGPWAGLVGGIYGDGASAGRYRFAYDQGPTANFSVATPRCVGYINSL